MSTKRRWSLWPTRIANELNIKSGVGGLASALIGIGGWNLFSGIPSLILTGVGVFSSVAIFGHAIYKAIPPTVNRPEDLVGQRVLLKDLENILPKIKTLSIIGYSMVGKTTLRDRLTFAPSTPIRTQDISAHIVALQTPPPTYIAILDGSGERYAQQFILAEACECLCIIIDHNSSSTDSCVQKQRLNEQQEFLRQVMHFLDEHNATPKIWIYFLVNKHDLWAHAPVEEQKTLTDFYEQEITHWRQGNRAKTIKIFPHSNSNPDDVVRFVDLLKNTALS